MNWVENLLLVSLFWLFYVYLGYPAILWLLTCYRETPPNRCGCESWPTVSILIAARNEAEALPETLRGLLELRYPRGNLEILVMSDGSDDGTDAFLSEFAATVAARRIGFQWFRSDTARGKTAALNHLVEMARGDVLVFADANSRFDPPAVERLVAVLVRKSVGYVTGRQIPMKSGNGAVASGASAFQRYEHALRQWESSLGAVIGCDGGIDAMWRRLYEPLRPDQLPDFVQPLKVLQKGHRVEYAPEATMREVVHHLPEPEWKMRRRVALRALWALWDQRAQLLPVPAPRVAWQIWSHKLLRYMAPIPQALALFANILLLGSGVTYQVLMILQVAFYLMAYWGKVSRHFPDNRWLNMIRPSGFFVLPYYLTLTHFAFAAALQDFYKGQRKTTWTPRMD